jgi:hypothetical protein
LPIDAAKEEFKKGKRIKKFAAFSLFVTALPINISLLGGYGNTSKKRQRQH